MKDYDLYVRRNLKRGYNRKELNVGPIHASRIKTSENLSKIKTEIKDHASIGTSVTILGGITIGFNALIGAGSVVTKNIPDNAVAAGNPAKIIRFLK